MRKSPINTYSLKWSCGLHGLLLFSAAIVPLLPQYRPREIPLITEFTVVLKENLIEPAAVSPSPAPTPDPTPPKPEPIPEPKKPAALPEPKDVIPIEPPKKKEKPDPPKPPEPTPFQKGKRVELPPDKKQPDFSKLKPVTEKQLTKAEIEKLLRDGVKPGVRNQVPPNEASRCFSLIKQALYDAWAQPGAGGGNPVATLEIRLDSTGRIISYQITKTSGNPHFDQTVLKAAAACQPIRGLSLGFLKQYERLTVEFRLQ